MDALLDMAGTIYTVNLTRDTLERNISPAGKSDSDRALFLDYPLPCSYRDYCDEYRKRVTPATLGSYRTADTSARLLKRFAAGEKHITVEYCVQEDDGAIRWVQKTVLMTRMVVFDTEILAEVPMIYAIILLQDTTQRHERDEQEQARLQAAFNEMRAEAKQENVTSNVISSKEAYAVKLVTHIEIQTEETDATISETQTTLHLKAWVTPVLATIANVEWSIVEGEEFATINKDGVLTANMGAKAGAVVVQAKAIDGSEVMAERTFDIPQSTGISAVTDGASAVTILSGYGNILVKYATGLMRITTANGAVVHSSVVDGERKVYLPAGIYIVKIGKTVRKVVVR